MTFKRFLLVCLIVLLVIISMTGLAQYFWPSEKGLELARAQNNDLYLQSDEGVTRCKIFGDARQPTVILIHSFNGYLEKSSLYPETHNKELHHNTKPKIVNAFLRRANLLAGGTAS